MAHMKRIAMPKTWPLKKKGKTFVIKPHGPYKLEESLPLTIIMREILQQVGSFREARKVIKAGEILVNNKIMKNEKFGVGIFDKISIPSMDKYFELIIGKKLMIREINKEESNKKICKVIGKKTLNKDKVQMNLFGGLNILIGKEFKIKTGDSVLINLENLSVIKALPFEVGANCFVIGGKHIGKEGKIIEISKEANKKIVSIETKDGKMKILKENALITE